MSKKTILLPIHDDAGQSARVESALAVAAAIEARITCLDIVVQPVPMGDDWGISALALDIARAESGANREKIEARLRSSPVEHRWLYATGDFARIVCECCADADLTIVNNGGGFGETDETGNIAGAVLASGARAVLAVPCDRPIVDLRAPAMVAWDESPAAQAALHAALPLLMRATRVVIAVVDGDHHAIRTDAAAALLSSLGLETAVARAAQEGDVALSLLQAVRSRTPAYLVMGGFGGGRLRETLLGGVSRTLLRDSPVPLLLAAPQH